jgi:branched-chain amino acid transport system ATP-binding protein
MLEVTDLKVSYGPIQALKGVSLQVGDEAVAVLGANGAGKSTLIKAILGWVQPLSGRITFDGKELTGMKPWDRAALGIGVVPEGGRVFGALSVAQNLALGAYQITDRKGVEAALDRVYALFPVLAERKRQTASTLSGGERQMLAIGRALMAQPRLLLIDEVSMGLMPRMVASTFQALRAILQSGTSLLVVEQNVGESLAIVERGYVLENGQVVLEGTAETLRHDEKVKQAYLGG